MIAIIAAYDNKRAIGQNGQIPWSIKTDMDNFRSVTMGGTIVMGKNTYNSIGKALDGRQNIVVTSSEINDDNIQTARTCVEALSLADRENIFICGGERIYKSFIDIADTLYLTEIDSDFDGDRFFPDFDDNDFTLESSESFFDNYNCIFKIYKRNPLGVDYINSYLDSVQQSKGILLGLDAVRSLLNCLGNPQDKMKIVHISGTNGKGSTGAMIASSLRKAGYKTGHFSSPAVFSPLEMFMIDSQPISDEDYYSYMNRIISCHKFLRKMGITPTIFEMQTALAFYAFADKGCDYAVVECGMGGNTDATNITMTDVLTVITSIGIDHTSFLGSTIEEITATKCGIMRKGTPVVVQEQDYNKAISIIDEQAHNLNCPLCYVNTDDIKNIAINRTSLSFNYKCEAYTMPMIAEYQCKNSACAIEALHALDIDTCDIKEGLKAVKWNGRFQLIKHKPAVIIDGAHNLQGAVQLKNSILAYQNSNNLKNITIIMGMLADKDFDSYAALVAPLAKRIYTITPNNPRALTADKLADCIKKYNDNVLPYGLKEAIKNGICQSNEDDMVVICGSLYYLGDAVKELNGGDFIWKE